MTLDVKLKEPEMDWQQVVQNGGPPCFKVEGPRFCGRAQRWQGHPVDHQFVSLANYVERERLEARLQGANESILAFANEYASLTQAGTLHSIAVPMGLKAAEKRIADLEGRLQEAEKGVSDGTK